MKKALFLLPIAMLALTGCGNDDNTDNKGNTDGGGSGSSTTIPDGGLKLNYDSFYDESKKSYADYTGEYTVNDFVVSLDTVMCNKYANAQVGATLSVDDFPVLQFKASVATLTVNDILPTKVTVKIYTTYDYSLPLSLSFDGGTVTDPTTTPTAVDTGATLSKGEKSYSVKSYEVIYTVSGTAASNLVIANTNKYACYVDSITIE